LIAQGLSTNLYAVTGQGERRRTDREPHGFLPSAEDAAPRWRRVRAWLLGGREEIDQEGLVAERTLLVRPRRITREAPADDATDPGSRRDEARR
jgi:hypothetical protein